jgi:hypothetical protein
VTNQARSYLETAVTLSGEFRFVSEDSLLSVACWNVGTIVLQARATRGPIGYVISNVLADPSGHVISHELEVGPDEHVLDEAMREAARNFAKHVRASQANKE